ncbi:hypothetical protein PVAP13_2NG476312 [Panicum virgatum]|uniref:Uncharacterized protein n=1 Tax=Panicum virgatum TaxID=38727 RepID=A0A8T0VNK8_PANVG|nr:hypothetical protein PVAP13_2NG476312 [Panicum virgatum]
MVLRLLAACGLRIRQGCPGCLRVSPRLSSRQLLAVMASNSDFPLSPCSGQGTMNKSLQVSQHRHDITSTILFVANTEVRPVNVWTDHQY